MAEEAKGLQIGSERDVPHLALIHYSFWSMQYNAMGEKQKKKKGNCKAYVLLWVQ